MVTGNTETLPQASNLPAVASADGMLIYDGSNWIVLEGGVDLTNIFQNIAENNLELIELQANASLTPINHDTVVVETFNDADGYNNLVNTGNTTSIYGAGRYSGNVSNQVAQTKASGGAGTQASTLNYYGDRYTADQNGYITKVTKTAPCTATKVAIIRVSDGVTLATGTFVGNDASVLAQIISGQDYYVMIHKDETSFTRDYSATGQTFPSDLGKITLVQQYKSTDLVTFESTVGDTDRYYDIASVTVGDSISSSLIEIDLPTITGNVIATQLIVNAIDPSTLTYDIIDTDSTGDTSQPIDTKNTLTNPDGTKITGGKIKINLTGIEVVKTFALKLWKS